LNKHQIIHNPIPKNIPSKFENLFSPLEYSKIREPEIKHINKAFVTYQGLVLKNGLLAKGCAFNLTGNADNTFYYKFWRDTIEKWAVCKWGKSLKSLHLKAPQEYLLIHSKWFNYAFWINSFLVRLVMAEKAGLLNQVKLLIPETWGNFIFVKDSLNAFDVQHEIIPTDNNIFVDKLVMPETRQFTSYFYPPHIKITAKRLVDEAKQRTKGEIFSKKVYLSRAKRKVRCVENESQVIDYLQKQNFEVVTFEDLNIWQQIAMMNNATHFVSIHGAGFSNAMFMKKGAQAIELMEYDFAHYGNPLPHWKLCSAVEVNYNLLLCKSKETEFIKKVSINKSTSKKRTQLVNRNIFVDIEMLEKMMMC
jgi:hypothetical protein